MAYEAWERDHDTKILNGFDTAEFVITHQPHKIFVEYAHLRGSVELGELGISYGPNTDAKYWELKQNGDATGAMKWALEQTKAQMLAIADKVRADIAARRAIA